MTLRTFKLFLGREKVPNSEHGFSGSETGMARLINTSSKKFKLI
jgi:hypothetical protein